MSIKFKKIDIYDLEQLRMWRMQENVTKYMITDPSITPEYQIKWFDRISKDNSRLDYVISVDDVKIGYYGITGINHELKSCEVGFYIGNDNYRGKGLFREIQAMAENIIVNELNLVLINIEVLENNPIIKVYYRLGFKKSNLPNRHIIKNGESLVVINLNKQINR